MQRPPIPCVSSDVDVGVAAIRLASSGARQLLVVDDGRLVGSLSTSDVMRSAALGNEPWPIQGLHGRGCARLLVEAHISEHKSRTSVTPCVLLRLFIVRSTSVSSVCRPCADDNRESPDSLCHPPQLPYQ